MSNKSFEDTVAEYTAAFLADYPDCGSLRAEAHVESLRDWSLTGSFEETIAWFENQQVVSALTVSDIRLDECRGWYHDEDTGWLRHESGDFFFVQGVRIEHSHSREVGSRGWDQPILTQVGYDGGILGLLRKRIAGVPHYLVEAKAEPGNQTVSRSAQHFRQLSATSSVLTQAVNHVLPSFSNSRSGWEEVSCSNNGCPRMVGDFI